MSPHQNVFTAARTGDIDTLRPLLASNPELARVRGVWNQTPLHFAARHGHLEAVSLLVEHGAWVNAVEERHRLTPLAWAAVFGMGAGEVADDLLARGASLDVFSAVALGWAGEVRAMLRASHERAKRSEFLCFIGHESSMRMIVKADPNVLNARMTDHDDAMQPLHLAVLKDRPEMAELLVRAGADLEGRTLTGRTPLRLAAMEGKRRMADLLLRWGAESDDQTALALSRVGRPAVQRRDFSHRPLRRHPLPRRPRSMERVRG